MAFVDKITSSSQQLIYLVRGKNQGHDAWHYISIHNRLMLPIFLENTKYNNLDISKYGKILYSGWGKNPPDDIIKQINEAYGGLL